ncbi:hypothetical protein [Candidatus Competibacter phosphatis]|uniref:hypothetical protein n=1 Tax=Candidatus Competibacter phosphatis TaxID=221280 RepID=UPI00145F7F02|nr:hypothetical protein [Candidatus Competibacter phosphatis]
MALTTPVDLRRALLMEGGDLRWTVRKARMIAGLLRPVSDAPRLGIDSTAKTVNILNPF